MSQLARARSLVDGPPLTYEQLTNAGFVLSEDSSDSETGLCAGCGKDLKVGCTVESPLRKASVCVGGFCAIAADIPKNMTMFTVPSDTRTRAATAPLPVPSLPTEPGPGQATITHFFSSVKSASAGEAGAGAGAGTSS